jgi:hypothetical protein
LGTPLSTGASLPRVDLGGHWFKKPFLKTKSGLVADVRLPELVVRRAEPQEEGAE